MRLQEVAQTGEMTNLSAQIKSAFDIFYGYRVFLVYLPFSTAITACRTNGTSSALTIFVLFTQSLKYFNLSLNPAYHLLLEDDTFDKLS